MRCLPWYPIPAFLGILVACAPVPTGEVTAGGPVSQTQAQLADNAIDTMSCLRLAEQSLAQVQPLSQVAALNQVAAYRVSDLTAGGEQDVSLADLPATLSGLTGFPTIATASMQPVSWSSFEGQGPATGDRYLVRNPDGTLFAYMATVQATLSGEVFRSYDLDTAYQAQSDGSRTPTQLVHDAVSVLLGNHLHLTETLDPTTGLWDGTATWHRGPDGVDATITQTRGAHLLGKQIAFTRNGHDVLLAHSFGPDGSGSGSLSVDGTAIATLDWDAAGEGHMTFVSGQQLPYEVAVY